jgi:hypothetical protein
MVKNDKSRNKNEKKRFGRTETQVVAVNVTVFTHVGYPPAAIQSVFNWIVHVYEPATPEGNGNLNNTTFVPLAEIVSDG